jgi:hypothetical protein
MTGEFELSKLSSKPFRPLYGRTRNGEYLPPHRLSI